jgi:hypothetical protein
MEVEIIFKTEREEYFNKTPPLRNLGVSPPGMPLGQLRANDIY